MADDDVTTDDAPPETPSEEGVPAEDESETPSDETTDEPEGEPSDDEEEEPEADEIEPEPKTEPEGDDEEDSAWKNFQKKFNHLHSDRDRKAAMGKAFWEKTRYASTVRKENETLKTRLAQLEAAKAQPPAPPAEPPPPPPELARIEQRIQVLYQKDQGIKQSQDRALIELSDTDKQVAIIEDRLKDADDDYQKALLTQRLETAKVKRETVLNRWADLNERRENISLEMEQRLTDRDWTQKFLQDKASRDQQERQSLEKFNADFPKHVDSLIEAAADDLKAPEDRKIRQSLWRSVNRAIMVDLWQLGDQGLQQVNVPAMVRAHVQEYLEDRDLVGRAKFKRQSEEKLKVTGREAPKGRPAAAPPKAPVPPSLLSTGGLSPAMLRARQILTTKFGGGSV